MFTLATLHEEGSDIRVPPWDLSPPCTQEYIYIMLMVII
jgi:hypothetical protein